jgi:hypothetical protein
VAVFHSRLHVNLRELFYWRHSAFDPRREVAHVISHPHGVRPQVGRHHRWPPLPSVDDHGARQVLKISDFIFGATVLMVGVDGAITDRLVSSIYRFREVCFGKYSVIRVIVLAVHTMRFGE